MSLSSDGAGVNAFFVKESLAELGVSNGRVDDFACTRSSCLRVKEETSDRLFAVPFPIPSSFADTRLDDHPSTAAGSKA